MIRSNSEHIVKRTRKQHRCFGCNEIMLVGSTVNVAVCVDDDNGFYSLYMHLHCKKIIDSIPNNYFYEGEIPEGAIVEYLDDIGYKGTVENYAEDL